MLGTAVASADLFGIDIDVLHIFDHKDKKKKSDRKAKVGNQRGSGAKNSGGGLTGPNASTGPKAKVGASGSSGSSGLRQKWAPVSHPLRHLSRHRPTRPRNRRA
ncbi:hypothetical protein ABFW11_31400, partial [Mycolicibacterium porcinum]